MPGETRPKDTVARERERKREKEKTRPLFSSGMASASLSSLLPPPSLFHESEPARVSIFARGTTGRRREREEAARSKPSIDRHRRRMADSRSIRAHTVGDPYMHARAHHVRARDDLACLYACPCVRGRAREYRDQGRNPRNTYEHARSLIPSPKRRRTSLSPAAIPLTKTGSVSLSLSYSLARDPPKSCEWAPRGYPAARVR